MNSSSVNEGLLLVHAAMTVFIVGVIWFAWWSANWRQSFLSAMPSEDREWKARHSWIWQQAEPR